MYKDFMLFSSLRSFDRAGQCHILYPRIGRMIRNFRRCGSGESHVRLHLDEMESIDMA